MSAPSLLPGHVIAMQTQTFVWHVFTAVSLMIVKYQLVSAAVQPNKCYFLLSFFYSTFDVSFRADFGQGFKIFGVLLLQGIYIFSNPEVTADCKLAAFTSSLLTEFSYSNFKYN